MTLFDLAKKSSPWRLISSLNLGDRLNGAVAEGPVAEANQEGQKSDSLAVSTPSVTKERETMATVGYEVAHHVRGRIRLRIPLLGDDADFARRLLEEVELLPAVNRARIRPRTHSLVVEFEGRPSSSVQNDQGDNTTAVIMPELARAIQTAANEAMVVDLARQPENEVDGNGQIDYIQRLGLPVLGLGMGAGMLAGLAIPPLLVGGTVLVSAVPIFKRTVQGITEEKKLTVDFLDSTTIVLLTAQASFFAPATIVGVIEGSELLRDWTARRSKQASLALLMDQEQQVAVERKGQLEHVPLDEVAIDDIILVYSGDQIPVDGLVLDGRAAVDQHQVTGDSIPVLCAPGDTVHASTLVAEGHLRLRARRTGHDTHVGQMMSAMQAAPETDTRVSNYARKVGNWAVLPTLATGGLVYGASGSLGRLTGIVSMDLGTGMRVSAPIAILNAQSAAARRGILLRSGRALEALSQIDTIIFDKTATLTQGRATIIEVQSIGPDVTERELLALAASAEAALSHPIAESIVRFASDHEIETIPCTEWNYLPGLGVEARINGQLVHVGNRRYMNQLGIIAANQDALVVKPHLVPSICVYMAQGGQLLGMIYCADPVRIESAAVIEKLRADQITPYLLSGDDRSVTNAVGAKLGFSPVQVLAEALPRQKLQLVESLQADGRTVAFVGDGINDAAAMAQADVSIALGGATDLARETADIVLMNDDLRDLIVAQDIAHHAMRIIAQNKALVVVPNVGGIAYGALAAMSPIAGVVINNGSALVVALNSLRPAPKPKGNTHQQQLVGLLADQPTLEEEYRNDKRQE